ncbi:MAG: rhodanese-like domain-containing protein [Roseiarcus sp.]|jgi:rhodanese-related sulfurtransferase|uniref:rhodanese-like domain-containing protein n=1 Tax=Roseiarcus sp. TaxID=1969460 RepID=UPI003C1AC63A
MSFQRPADYAGELSVADAYTLLKEDEKAELVDVRTPAEWTWVGVPDLGDLGRTPIFVEWASYPGMRPAADFAQRVIAELTARGADQETPVLFLCRSGVRSLAAARALASAGWRRCYNVSEGFEGGLDAATHRRGGLGGWRAGGLPWTQT